MHLTLVLSFAILLAFSAHGFAQSRRAAPQPANQNRSQTGSNQQSVKEMFDEANKYRDAKFEEFASKKIPFNERLRMQTEREQRQLAAKFAAAASTRTGLTAEDIYYLALLHWIAENLDGTSETLRKYLASDQKTPERVQTARSLLVVVAAKQKKFDDALTVLTDYQRSEPVKPSEKLRMNTEIAKAYLADKQPAKAAPFAAEAFAISRTLVADATLKSVGMDLVYDNAMLLFDAHRQTNEPKLAETALEDLRKTAASLGSTVFYFYAADKQIVYQIETGRKPQAMDTYLTSLILAAKELPLEGQRRDAIARLKKREKHYKLLGDPAPELSGIDKWIPEKSTTLAELKGKVVLLDFWATWCAPCFDAFPSLVEWQQDFAADGFKIIGVTRYYGQADGMNADRPSEIAFLQRFKVKFGLPYDFAVSKDVSTQLQYGADSLPTAVLVDRKGVVRYIESGTSTSRLEDLREMILKLLAEK